MKKQSGQQKSTSKRKYCKITPPMRQLIYKMLGEWYSLREISAVIEKEFGIRVHYSSIDKLQKRYPEEAGPAIKAAREAFQSFSIMNFPIANKVWRLREILRMYLDSDPKKDKLFRAKLLALGRAEIGENFDKLASAIRDSGGDPVVNVVNVINYDSEELQRAIAELAAVSANSNTVSRF